MLGILPIEKDKIPYTFDVNLSNKVYSITLKYNNFSDEFTADLSLGDKILVQGKKLLLGESIFGDFALDNSGNLREDFYSESIIPYDLTWQEDKLSLDNLGIKVFLYVIEDE